MCNGFPHAAVIVATTATAAATENCLAAFKANYESLYVGAFSTLHPEKTLSLPHFPRHFRPAGNQNLGKTRSRDLKNACILINIDCKLFSVGGSRCGFNLVFKMCFRVGYKQAHNPLSQCADKCLPITGYTKSARPYPRIGIMQIEEGMMGLPKFAFQFCSRRLHPPFPFCLPCPNSFALFFQLCSALSVIQCCARQRGKMCTCCTSRQAFPVVQMENGRGFEVLSCPN